MMNIRDMIMREMGLFSAANGTVSSMDSISGGTEPVIVETPPPFVQKVLQEPVMRSEPDVELGELPMAAEQFNEGDERAVESEANCQAVQVPDPGFCSSEIRSYRIKPYMPQIGDVRKAEPETFQGSENGLIKAHFSDLPKPKTQADNGGEEEGHQQEKGENRGLRGHPQEGYAEVQITDRNVDRTFRSQEEMFSGDEENPSDHLDSKRSL
jgi:hypothetical protein